MSSPYLPKKLFLTRGVGRHRQRLTSFAMALRSAAIAQYNLARVSPTFPAHCKLISPEEGAKIPKPGQIVHAALSQNATNEARQLTASVGVAIPKDHALHGYISLHHSFGQTEKQAGDYAEDLAATMLATILGINFDPNTSYDERKDIWRMSDKIVVTRHITQSAVGDGDGIWTSVIAAAIFAE